MAREHATLKSAISAINEQGMLLVFPLDNQKDPPSLWSHFYPRSRMRWEWDDDGDNRVSGLWHLRAELARSGKVVYSKWYRGRATFLSKPLFASMLRSLNPVLPTDSAPVGETASGLLRQLELDSPLSTKALKAATGLQGRLNERDYTRGLRELWSRLLIVGFGEVDDGAFPSLAIGASRSLFEAEWEKARELSPREAEEASLRQLAEDSAFGHFYRGELKRLGTPRASEARGRDFPAALDAGFH